MDLAAIDAYLLDLPLVEPFAASHGTTNTRTVVVIRIVADDSVGWGECSALPAATYSLESAAGSFGLLTDHLLPELMAGNAPATTRGLALLGERFGPAPMALAAVEMAFLDAELTAAGTPLARWLGAERRHVPAGVSLGLDRPEAVVERAASLVGEGYRRLKVKIQPGHDLGVLRALRADATIGAAPVEIQLDANGAYRSADIDLLVTLAEAGADVLEQPLATDDVDGAVELVDRLARFGETEDGHPVAVVADEAITSLADAEALAERGALTGVSIKPARVGGLRTARRLHDWCQTNGLSATAGGMLETGLGRHALAALAALPGFDLTGDLSPAARWLAADPWPDLQMVDGHIVVPSQPGVAPAPDPELVAEYTVEQRHWE